MLSNYLFVQGEKYALVPSFKALVAAEEELGPLFCLVQQYESQGLAPAQAAALFWHCLPPAHNLTRAQLEARVAGGGWRTASACLSLLIETIQHGTPVGEIAENNY